MGAKPLGASETQILVSVLVDDVSLAAKLVSRCRDEKLKAEYMVNKRLAKQFDRAKELGIPWMVIVGEREINKGIVLIINKEDKIDMEVPESEFVYELVRLICVYGGTKLYQPLCASETQILVSVLVDDVSLAAKLVSRCWEVKLKAEYMVNKRLAKQFDRAKELGIPWMVIVGEREINKGIVLIINKEDKIDMEVPESEVVYELVRLICVYGTELYQPLRARESQILVSVLVDDASLAAKLVSRCWEGKLKAEYMVDKRLAKQFDRAKELGIPWMVVVGEREITEGIVLIINKEAKVEIEVSESRFVYELSSLMKNSSNYS